MQKQRKGSQKPQCNDGAAPWSLLRGRAVWCISLNSSTGAGASIQVHNGSFRSTSTWIPDWLEPEGWWLRFLDHPVTSPATNQKKVIYPEAVPQIAFKNSSLKATGEFGLFEHWDVRSPCLALAINLSLLQNPMLWFAYLPCRAHKLGFNNILSHYCFKFVFCSFLSFFSSWWYCAPQTGISTHVPVLKPSQNSNWKWNSQSFNWDCTPDPEKAMAPHSSTLAWKIPWMEEPGGLQSMGSLRVGSDTTERLHFHFSLSCIGEGNGNPLQDSCLENPQGRGSLMGCRLWGHTESDTTEVT